MNVLETAIELRRIGLAVHWLHPASKVPVAEGWSTAPAMTEEELRASYVGGYNVGFRPGRWSQVGGDEIVVLDVDIRGGPAFQQEAFAAANTLMGGKFDPHVQSGSLVGRHQLLRMPAGTAPNTAAITLRQSDIWTCDGRQCAQGTKGAKPAWQLELLSTGKNVVLPPSIHPDTGNPYTFIRSMK